MQIEIGGIAFKSKAAAGRYASDLLRGLPLGEVPDEHVRFLIGLLDLHRNAVQKMGSGLVGFEVRKNPPFGSRSFWAIRRDGSATDFSYRECLTPSTSRADLLFTMRAEILDQIEGFRRDELARGASCPITGAPLAQGACDVDHEPPFFANMVDAFLATKGLGADETYIRSADGQTRAMLQDRKLASEWCEYHRANARLRLLSTEGHRELTKTRRAS